jgi:hypothetical protein
MRNKRYDNGLVAVAFWVVVGAILFGVVSW